MNLQQELTTFPIVQTFRVQWGEMDAFRHVNNLVYLRWAESGRIAYFEQLPLDFSTPELARFSVVLGWQDCKYIFPVTYPDTIHVGTNVIEIKNDRFVMQCKMYSEKHQRLVTISKHEVVTVNFQLNKKVNVPTEIRQAIEKIEK
ncbi:MAG: acyl-CoA thioesterase [Saprospiraceae bacterium]